jgi:uncharacterized Tic20 family protein/DNA-binding transcriptional regulator YiaG
MTLSHNKVDVTFTPINETLIMKNKDLSKRVKELRIRKGFSQEELSEISGLGLRTIQRLENGETEPRGDSLRRLSNSLGVTPDEILDWTMQEDRSFLMGLNLSSLSFILFPLLGILVPLIMWISKKDKIKDINVISKDVLNFQITWTMLLFLGFIINIIILSHGIKVSGDATPAKLLSSLGRNFLLMAFMYLYNLVFIIVNTIRIQNEKNVKYFPKIPFLKTRIL